MRGETELPHHLRQQPVLHGVDALLAPPKLSLPVQERLNGEMNKAFRDPAFREQFVAQGVRFVGGTPEDLEAHMRAETERWSKVFAAMGVKPQ